MGTPCQSLLRSVPEITKGARHLVSLNKMNRQFRRQLARLNTVALLQPRPDLNMQTGPAARWNTAVEGLAIQVVHEYVAGRNCPIRPTRPPACVQENTLPRQSVASRFHFFVRFRNSSRYRARGELPPHNARRFEYRLLLTGDHGQLPVHQL